MTNGTKMPREWHQAYEERYRQRPEVKERLAARAKARVSNPAERHKWLARWKTQRAIASGRLLRQPCEVCGIAKVDAHHDDYSEPLNVRWLCRKHHLEHHAKVTP